MKITVVGVERTEGTSKDKPGQPGSGGRAYSIGKVHAIVPLDTSRNGEKSNSKGFMGTSFENVPVECIRRIEHNSFPFQAELVIEQVMRFGKLEGRIMDIRPVSQAKPETPVLKAA